MTDTIRLKEAIHKNGFKMKYLADKLGISYMGFNKKLNNLSQFKASEIEILCDTLKINTLTEKERIFFAK